MSNSIRDVEAYLCLTMDGCYIAHEGRLTELPPEVIEVWTKQGGNYVRKTTWIEGKDND